MLCATPRIIPVDYVLIYYCIRRHFRNKINIIKIPIVFHRISLQYKMVLNLFRAENRVRSKADDPKGRKQTILKRMKADDPGRKQTIYGSNQTIRGESRRSLVQSRRSFEPKQTIYGSKQTIQVKADDLKG